MQRIAGGVAAILMVCPLPLVAQTYYPNYWICSFGHWQDGGCWTRQHPPYSLYEDAIISRSRASLVVVDAQTGGAMAATITLGATGHETVRLHHAGGGLDALLLQMASLYESDPDSKAVYELSSGYANIEDVDVGRQGNALLDIHGAKSNWTSDGMYIGKGGNGRLNLEDSAHLFANRLFVGAVSGSHGVVNVSGKDTLLSADSIIVGFDGGVGGLVLDDKAQLHAASVEMGGGGEGSIVVSNKAEMTVDDMRLSGPFSGVSVRIDHGGSLEVQTLTFDFSKSATLDLSGPDSSMRIAQGLHVLGPGNIASIHVRNGAYLYSEESEIGWYVSSSEIQVSGKGTFWENPGNLSLVGGLRIESGGTLVSGNSKVEQGGHASVSGPFSTWRAATLNVKNGRVGVEDRATLESGRVFLDGELAIGTGSEMHASQIYIGWKGAGRLDISDGGVLYTNDARVGTTEESTAFVKLAGSRSAWFVTGDVWTGEDTHSYAVRPDKVSLRNGAQMHVAGRMHVRPSGSLNLEDANLSAGQGTEMAGLLQLSGKSRLEGDIEIQATGVARALQNSRTWFAGDVLNEGSMEFQDATADFSGTFRQGGNFRAYGSDTELRFHGPAILEDDISGAGATLIFDDALIPGAGETVWLRIEGNLLLSDSASLHIDIGKRGSFLDPLADILYVGGDVQLNGLLTVSAPEDFPWQAGQRFTIISADAVTGSFSSLDFPMLPDSLAWELQILPSTVQLHVQTVPLPASFWLFVGGFAFLVSCGWPSIRQETGG